MHTLPDSELLSRFREENTREQAFTALMKRYQERLYWHIRRMVLSHADADDVLQQVFIRIWNGLPGFREDARLFTWMYRIATNECLSFLKEKQKRLKHSSETAPEALENSLREEPGFREDQMLWKLQMAVAQLPEKQRLVFHMRYYDELDYAEISDILGTSEGALKASYHHAVKKIEAFLRED